ncbi:hypothetical protein RSAG8_03766, partial [Rhizoctonia solani AG-8 WAC10335]
MSTGRNARTAKDPPAATAPATPTPRLSQVPKVLPDSPTTASDYRVRHGYVTRDYITTQELITTLNRIVKHDPNNSCVGLTAAAAQLLPEAVENFLVPTPSRQNRRRVRAQGSRILVEPKDGPLRDSTSDLSTRALMQKAQLAWDAAYEALSKDNPTTDPGGPHRPRTVFKTTTRLPRGGIEYKLETRTQATYLGEGAMVLLRCAPITLQPDNPAFISSFKCDNELSLDQGHLTAWTTLHEVADKLIAYGGVLDYERIIIEKAQREPTCCHRCQRFGHKAATCKAETNICSRHGRPHLSTECDKDTFDCVKCGSDQHASHKRSCPTYQAKLRRFNKSIPENRLLFFDLSAYA